MTAPLAFEGVPLGGRGSQPVTLEVPARETVALLGDEDSGIGRLGGYALGLDQPPAGRALVFGTEISRLPERERLAFRRRVGYLPAGDALLQNLSLRDNVALPLRFGSAATTRSGYLRAAAAIHAGSSFCTPPTPSSTTLTTLCRFIAST